jgi:hypothetical protein
LDCSGLAEPDAPTPAAAPTPGWSLTAFLNITISSGTSRGAEEYGLLGQLDDNGSENRRKSLVGRAPARATCINKVVNKERENKNTCC